MFKFTLDTHDMAIVTAASVAIASYAVYQFFAVSKLAKDHVHSQTKIFNNLASDHYQLIVEHAIVQSELARLKEEN